MASSPFFPGIGKPLYAVISTCTPMTFSCTFRFVRVTKRKRCMSSSIVWTTARVITFTHRREHISPVLRSLHWLPTHRRIEFYLCLHDIAPQYLAEMLTTMLSHVHCVRLINNYLLCRGANSNEMATAPLMLSRQFYGTHYQNVWNRLALQHRLREHWKHFCSAKNMVWLTDTSSLDIDLDITIFIIIISIVHLSNILNNADYSF